MTSAERLDLIHQTIAKCITTYGEQCNGMKIDEALINAGIMHAHALVREQWRYALNLGCIEATKVLDNMAKTIFDDMMGIK